MCLTGAYPFPSSRDTTRRIKLPICTADVYNAYFHLFQPQATNGRMSCTISSAIHMLISGE